MTAYSPFLRDAPPVHAVPHPGADGPAPAVTDRNSLAGIVRAFEVSNDTVIRLIVGCRPDLRCGMSVLVYPMHRAGHGSLCHLLPGHGADGKKACHLD